MNASSFKQNKKIKKCCRQKPSSHKKNKKERTFCSCCKLTQNPAARRFHRFSYQRLLSKKKKKERKVVKQSFYLQLFGVLVRVAVRFRVCWIVRRVRDVKVFIGGRPGHVLYVQGGGAAHTRHASVHAKHMDPYNREQNELVHSVLTCLSCRKS